MKTIMDRVDHLPWNAIYRNLESVGFSSIHKLLDGDECKDIIHGYTADNRYRKVINMSKYRFGSGEYKYFDAPLPAIVENLRHTLYPRLATAANKWMEQLRIDRSFPGTLNEFLEICHSSGQIKPTPLILRYEAGDYNALHQDLYGEIFFPFQVVLMLSDSQDYSGGEFMLLEQRPRAQSIGHVVTLQQGEGVIFPTQYRPAFGKRGYHRVKLRHGVSPLKSGVRYTLGIIFHDAT